MRSRFFLLLLLLVHPDILAQQWQTHTNMQDVHSIAVRGDVIWSATSGGVFSYDRATDSFRKYTNVDGLSSIDVQAIAVDQLGTVFTGAANGAINILQGESDWSAVLDIFRATEKPKRGINIIRIHNNMVYFGTDFGVTVFDALRKEFKDTYVKFGRLPSQSQVFDIFFHNDTIWVATSQGIGAASIRNLNLQDPQNWKSFSVTEGLPSRSIRTISMLNGEIVAGTDAGSSVYRNDRWQSAFPPIGDVAINRITQTANGIFIVTQQTLYFVRSFTEIEILGDPFGIAPYPTGARFSDIIETSGGEVLVASNLGVAAYESGAAWNFRKPNGPASNKFLSMQVDEQGLLWAASGSDGKGVGAHRYDGTSWSVLSKANQPDMPSDDVYAVGIGNEGDIWFGLWGDGVARQRADGTMQVFNATNTLGFPGIPNAPKFCVVTDVKRDVAGNMWFIHYLNGNGNIVSTFKRDESWTFYKNQSVQGPLAAWQLAIDLTGTKWIRNDDGTYRGFVYLNDNGTPDNFSDDSWGKLDALDKNGLAANSAVKSIAVDNLGDIWIGTDIGLRTIFNPRTPDRIARTCFNTRCNIEGESINDIAIDAVNNKWIGTNSGVFLLSPDGSTILAHYNTENSPLLDNVISTIAVHPRTGVAYFATRRGLSSLQTPYIRPPDSFETLRLIPNPFRPGLETNVTVEGLVESSTLKVLSIAGDLVAEVPTPGGSIGSWNGRDAQGRYVPSGIYFIVAYGADGKQTSVAKLAVVHP